MADYAGPRRGEEATRRVFITPEGVDLSLRLADPGQRLSAFLLDLLIMLGLLIALTVLVALGLASAEEAAAEPLAIIWLLGFFLLRNGYFIIMEMGPRAATFGKRALGLRVVSRSGGRLTADALIARNLVREIEIYLPLSFIGYRTAEGSIDGAAAGFGFVWTLIFLFFPFFNRDRLRVGDLLAGTWVINAPKRRLGLDLLADGAGQPAYKFTDEQLDAYGVFELQTLEQVLRAANPDTMGTVAFSIRTKIGAVQHGGDEEFLNAYYDALRLRLERNLLFGRRRADKHDRDTALPLQRR
ncbi:MAG TPA: RDD family protein [Allosphingosinicella sp.]|nr:RDD family protein [Allosphingosinicella sp.]